MSKIYIVAIFTASTQPYCDAIMEKLDPECLVTHRFYRDHCTNINSKISPNSHFLTQNLDYHVKDLSTFTNIPIKDMLIVDNYIYSFALNLENGICIKPYYEGKEDSELEYLSEALETRNPDPRSARTNLRDIVAYTLGLKNFYSYLGYRGK
jgi:RNA polymerase II subunit A small phosphatase-like protein